MAKVLKSSKVLDDKGREFPTVRIAGTQVWDGRDEVADLPEELAAACVAAVKQFQGACLPRWNSPWILGVLLALMCAGLYLSNGQLHGLVGPLVFPVYMLAVWELVRRSKKRRPFDERILATLIAAQRCASCGYSIVDSQPGSNGARTCSECGASWAVPDPSSLPLRRPGILDPIVPEADLAVADRLSSVDGRGRAVWIVDPANGIVPLNWRQIPTNCQQRLAERTRIQGQIERVGYVLAAVAATAMGGLMLWVSTRPGRATSAIAGVAFLAVGVMLAAKAIRHRTARSGETVSQIFLHNWVCPSCAAPFTDPMEEPDGCITCPTCRAAWRVKGAVAKSPGTV